MAITRKSSFFASNQTEQSKWQDVCPILLSVVSSRGSKVEETKREQNLRQECCTHFSPTAVLSHSVWSAGIPLHNTWEDFCPSILPNEEYTRAVTRVVNLTENSCREPDKLSAPALKETFARVDCGKPFANCIEVSQHVCENLPDDRITCYICDDVYGSNADLQRHIMQYAGIVETNASCLPE